MRIRSVLMGLAATALLAALLPATALAAEEGHWEFCETAKSGGSPVCTELITFPETRRFEFSPQTGFHGYYERTSSTELAFTEEFDGCHWTAKKGAKGVYSGEGECTEQNFQFTETMKPLGKEPKEKATETKKSSIHSETEHLACGTVGSTPVVGSAKLSRAGNAVTVKLALTKGAPQRTYLVFLAQPGCSSQIEVGKFMTSSKGAGKLTATVGVSHTENQFFLQLYQYKTFPAEKEDEGYKSTELVTLP